MPSYPMPYPQKSGQYDDSGMYRNPAGTIPFPQPADMPVGYWSGSQQLIELVPEAQFRLAAPPDPGWPFPYGRPLTYPLISHGATWSSPVFDLQPELRGVSNNQSNRSTLFTPVGQTERTPFTAVPIWGSAGKLLRVQMDNVNATYQFQILVWEEGHVIDPAQVAPITSTPGQDITSVFTSGAPAIAGSYKGCLTFAPTGGPSANRYWRLNLIFLQTSQYGPSPGDVGALTVQASYY